MEVNVSVSVGEKKQTLEQVEETFKVIGQQTVTSPETRCSSLACIPCLLVKTALY